MAISEEQVVQVAGLAKLSIEPAEQKEVTQQFDDIIEMFEQLNDVDTAGVQPLFRVNHQLNVLREDVAVAGTNRELLMKNVPENDGRFIKVPAIMDNGEGEA